MATEQELLAQLEALEKEDEQAQPVPQTPAEETDVTDEDELYNQLLAMEEADDGQFVARNEAVVDEPEPTATDEVAVTDVEETVPAPRRLGATGFNLKVPIRTPLSQAEGQTFAETKEQILPSTLGLVAGPAVGVLETADLAIGLAQGAYKAAFPEADQTRFEGFLDGIIKQFDEGYGESARKSLMEMGKEAGYNQEQLDVMNEGIFAGSLVGVGGLIKAGTKKTVKKTAREIGEATRAELAAKKLNINRAKLATEEEIAKKAEDAAEVAAKNDDIARELIVDFETRTGKSISTETAEGKLILDAEKARKAGVETAEEVAESNKGTVREFLRGDSSQTEAALLAGMGDKITQPLLKPEKFDALIATIADMKEKYPDGFKPKRFTNADGTPGKEYGVIDHLFDLTVNKELLAGDELIDMLNKYNISFEDYILTVVGSGSEAGKILQKLSQIKRMRPANEMIAMQEAATKEAAGALRKNIMRIENIRRGGLVSQVATAARNLQSGAIRAPLEGLGNVMDTALYNLTEEGVGAAAKSLGSFNNWKDSFRHMK